MTDTNTASERRFDIIKLYIRDLSFEVPNAPAAFQEKTQPKVDIELDSSNQAVGENVYEVNLTVRVSAKIDDRTLFLVEVVQSGLFGIAGFGDDEREVMLGSFCPGTLFPYVREVVSDTTAKGGFQPLLLAPVNFDAFYQARKQREAAMAKAPQLIAGSIGVPLLTGMSPIGVIGAGSWGTALAVCLARNGRSVQLWGHEPAHIGQLRAERSNRQFLPGVGFPETLQVSADLHELGTDCDDLLVVVPSEFFRSVLSQLTQVLQGPHRIAWATKGLEEGSGKLLHQVAAEVVAPGTPLAVVSGPTFAMEVARGLPTALTVASRDERFATDFAAALHGGELRAYTAQDVAGVEVGGAAKNVLAIAAGIADGLGFGANARAALITRGLREIMRLGVCLGGQPETFMGLTGMGDLVLTCTDDQSRNRRFGLAIGRGMTIGDARKSIDQVVEGLGTTRVVRELAQRLGVDMPIVEQVYQVLWNNQRPEAAVRSLFGREPKAEAG